MFFFPSEDLAKVGQAKSNKLVPQYQTVTNHTKPYQNRPKIATNQIKLDQIGSTWIKLDQIGL